MSFSKFRSFKAANYGINEDSPHVNIRRNYPKDSPYVDLYEQVYDRCEPDPDSVLVIEWGWMV